ncbi:hypothetical protein KI387_044364, partial [Taxus chinensis]
MEHIGRRIPSLDEGDHQTMISINRSVSLDSAKSHLAHHGPVCDGYVWPNPHQQRGHPVSHRDIGYQKP